MLKKLISNEEKKIVVYVFAPFLKISSGIIKAGKNVGTLLIYSSLKCKDIIIVLFFPLETTTV